MSKKKNKKSSNNVALVAELKEAKAEGKTISEIAQTIKPAETPAVTTTAQPAIKVRENMIVYKKPEELDLDDRAVIKQRRAYMMTKLAADNVEVYNNTMYRDPATNQLALMSQKIANGLIDDYIQSIAIGDRFRSRMLVTKFGTCGGAYDDKLRNRLYRVSLFLTKAQANAELTPEIKAAMQAKGKLCVYYNMLEDSNRRSYEFIRVF